MSELRKAELEVIYLEVMASGVLGETSRKKRLFEYLWEHSIGTTSINVTQYSIAFDVLGRTSSFNPETDGIVRTEIGRLRRALKNHSIQSKNYTIEIPRGKYELVISKKIDPLRGKAKAKKIGFAFMGLVILGLLFTVGVVTLNAPRTLTAQNELVCSDNSPVLEVRHRSKETALSAFILTTIEGVISQNSHVMLKAENCLSENVPHYLLELTSIEQRKQHRVILSIRPFNERKNLALVEFGFSLDEPDSYEDLFYTIALNINEMIKPYGLLGKNSLRQDWSNADAKYSYACLIKMYDYYESETDEDYLGVHNCLLEAEKYNQAPLDIHGALASSYLEQAKSYRALTDDDPFSKARNILSRNQGNISQSVELMIAQMALEAENPDFSSNKMDASLLRAETSFSTNPVVLLTASGYAGLKLGDWQRANRLSARAKRLTKQRDQSVYAVDAFNVIMSDNLDVNFEICFRYYSENLVFTNLVAKACAIKFDVEPWKVKTDSSLSHLGFESTEKQIAFLKERDWHPSLIDPMIDLISN